MDPLPEHTRGSPASSTREEAGAEALAAISSMSGQLPPAARAARLARRRRRQRARITFVAVRRQPHRRPDGRAPGSRRELSDALGGLDGLLQAGRAPTSARSRRRRRGGKLPKDQLLDGDASTARCARRAPQPPAAEVCYATTALASSTGSLLLDGLGSGSTSDEGGARRQMLTRVLLLQSAATQYGVRAEVDAYAPSSPSCSRPCSDRRAVRDDGAQACGDGGAAAPPLASLLATGQEDDETAADGDGDGDGLPTSRRRSPPAGRRSLHWRPSMSSRRS